MKKIISTAIFYVCYCATILSNPASLDTSFNHNGSTTNFFGSYTINQAQTLKVKNNGKILTAGYSGDNGVLVQYNNDGTLDHLFNASKTPGYIIVNTGTQTALYDLKLQDDNKIIVVGYTTKNNMDYALIIRYNFDGSIDTSFNSGNPIVAPFGNNSQLYGVAVQTDGKIVVSGWASYAGLTNALVARYTTNGTLDTTFNTIGYTTTLIGTVFTKARAIAVQNDNKIVIAGQAEIDSVQQFIVLRYLENGILDTTSFNSSDTNPGSIYPLSNYLSSTAHGLALQRDQKIIAVGSTNQDLPGFDNQSYTIVRINTDGTLDDSFNADDTPGFILSDAGLQASSATVQSNGQIITCGFNYSNNYLAIIARYNNDGSIDPTFNFVINDLQSNTLSNAIAIQADGKIVVSGTVSTHYSA